MSYFLTTISTTRTINPIRPCIKYGPVFSLLTSARRLFYPCKPHFLSFIFNPPAVRPTLSSASPSSHPHSVLPRHRPFVHLTFTPAIHEFSFAVWATHLDSKKCHSVLFFCSTCDLIFFFV